MTDAPKRTVLDWLAVTVFVGGIAALALCFAALGSGMAAPG